MKNTKTILVILFCLLGILSVKTQINISKDVKIDKNKKINNLKLITGGNQGFVYEESATLTPYKRISNAEIIFKSVDGKITKKVKTDNFGNYKIKLKPTKYVVSIKHTGYQFYSTVPSISVVSDKFSTFNIPLKKTEITASFVVIVLDNKTKELKDRIWYNEMKEYKKHFPNSIFIYATIAIQHNGAQITTLHLDKQFIIGKTSGIPKISNSKTPTQTKPVVDNKLFKPGRIIVLSPRDFKVISSTKEKIKLLMLPR